VKWKGNIKRWISFLFLQTIQNNIAFYFFLSLIFLFLVAPKMLFLVRGSYRFEIDLLLNGINATNHIELILWILLPSCFLIYCFLFHVIKSNRHKITRFLKVVLILYLITFLLNIVGLIEFAWYHQRAGFLDDAILVLINDSIMTHALFFSFLIAANITPHCIAYFKFKRNVLLTADSFLTLGGKLITLVSMTLITLTFIHFILYLHSQELIYRPSSWLLVSLLFSYTLITGLVLGLA
jgi:hypothetical protein